MGLKKYFGPSTLVAAAFIGPGTVTTCTLAGATTGYSLLFALAFSILATVVLQEMSARLGLITQSGLAEAIRKESPKAFKVFFLALVFIAILIGNAAYEAGNLSGAALGMDLVIPNFNYWQLVLGACSILLLYFSSYKTLEKILIALVFLMSVCFLITAIWVKPNLVDLFSGFIPKRLDQSNLLLVLGLIGTTVVPYNLFLHASTIKSKWKESSALKELRKESLIAILFGGFISMCIIVTSSGTIYGTGKEIANAADLSLQLEPLLGPFAKYMMALGLFAAGITSSITAPLAAAFCARGIFGWKENNKDYKFIAVWLFILLVGIVISLLGIKPIRIIQLAQVANGILLPIIACFLLYIMNKKELLGEYRNGLIRNIFGILIIGITLLISFKSLFAVFG